MTKKTAKKPTKKPKKINKSDLPGSRVKIRFGKHILPPLAGLVVAISIFGFFNSQLISGQIAYYLNQRKHISVSSLDSQVAANPVDKNAAPRILINKINVTAPVIFNQTVVNEANFLQALHSGVVHYPNTAVPGQVGNVVIFGHSSGQWWAPGSYKFVFTLLNKLKVDDKIFIEYKGVRYIYKVNNTKVVLPTDLTVLNQGSGHMLTLITCTPVGTSAKRLIIEAQQIVPAVNRNTSATTPAKAPSGSQKLNLPSSDDSFWHNLKQLF
jgi:LPXTG-site transpeptidase (sortase) family protein